MPSRSPEARRARSRIQEYLGRHKVNRDRPTEAYIRYQDIKDAWGGHETIEKALDPANLSNSEVDEIRARALRILSILVYIDAHDFLDDFRRQAFDGNGKLRLSDSELPFNRDEVPAIGDFSLQEKFFGEQYLFVPEVICESSTVKKIEDNRRLPFEWTSAQTFAGAYGEVVQVGISANHLERVDGDRNPRVKYVACKRFRPLRNARNDPTRELDNLQVLKESISYHRHIRLHLAIILHHGEHLILLPWAHHLDLEIFLREGHNLDGTEEYPFASRFPQIQKGALLGHVCTQMYHIADAIDWLHRGVIPQGSTHRNRVRFAHMDLKPNNILIDMDPSQDSPSPIGIWVLTDFGISAFKADDDSDTAKFVSVRDYFQNLTINTVPHRNPGSYQPPEVERENHLSSGRGNTAKEGSAGRRGDIWSFGCIFSEVLAFSLGQADLVQEFRNARKAHRNDYFYEIDSDRDTLMLPGAGPQYRVRPSIVRWLGELPGRFTFPKRAIDCTVETIQRILIPDGSMRPKAHELLRMLNHVKNHVLEAKNPGGYPSNCPLEHPFSPPLQALPSPPPLPTPRPSIPAETVTGFGVRGPGESGFIPSISRTDTINQEVLFSRFGGFQSGSDGASEPSGDRANSPNRNSVPTSLQAESPLGLGISNSPERGTPSFSDTLPTRTTGSGVREPRTALHALMNDPNKPRRIDGTMQALAPGLSKLETISFHLCSTGDRLAYLVKTTKSQHTVYLYKLRSSDRKVERIRSLDLPQGKDIQWKRVACAGNYVVVWGSCSGAKQAYISNGSASKVWTMADFKGLPALITVAVSKHGSLAFVSTKSILYTVADAEMPGRNSAPSRELIGVKSRNHSFTHAAFNDDGSLLYTWEFGSPDDRLSIWRIANDTLAPSLDSEGSYPSEKQGTGHVTLIPYNTYLGCIIHAQNDAFFPAQIRSTQRDGSDDLEKKTVALSNTVAACIYGDHSLLVVQKGQLLHTRIWEHHIVGGGTHVIDQSGTLVAELKGRISSDVQITVIQVPGSGDEVVVLCMSNGKVTMVPLVVDAGEENKNPA